MPTALSVFGVDPKRIGGNEVFARELSIQLHKAGWDSLLVFSKPPCAQVAEFLSLSNTRIETVPGVGRSGVTQCRHVVALMRASRPQIAHFHFVGFLTLYPWLAKATSRARVFFTDQSSHPEGFDGRRRPLWKRAVSALATRPYDGVVSVSAFNQCMMRRSGLVPPAKVHLIYNSVDVGRYNPDRSLGEVFRRRHGVPLDCVLVVQVSWLISEKGIPDLLEAARLVCDRRHDVHFLFVGEGPEQGQFEELARSLGLSNRVTWAGLVRDPFSDGVYHAADIVCQVSRWQEAFGWTIAEAMLCGKPVIGTRVGGIPEVIEDGVTGGLVDRRASRAIAAEVLRLAEDPALRITYGQAGRARCLKMFSLQDNVTRLLTLYGVDMEGQQGTDRATSVAVSLT